jgi:hypothetical protein
VHQGQLGNVNALIVSPKHRVEEERRGNPAFVVVLPDAVRRPVSGAQIGDRQLVPE